MIKSDLTNDVILAHSNNYTHGRDGQKICKITPHHMAGVLSGRQCANLFQKQGRQASANYCIGVNGDIVLSVPEEYRAWTSSSRWNDCRAITIEVSDCDLYWNISDASWNSLVNLCVDICKRYNFKLTYDGTKNGSLTRHNMFANTNCPGKPLQDRFPELVKVVNERLDGGTQSIQVPQDNLKNEVYVEMKKYKNGSTIEKVYSDTRLSRMIGYLNPFEECDCLGIQNNMAIVKYKIDKTEDYKIGFVKWLGGIK